MVYSECALILDEQIEEDKQTRAVMYVELT